VASTTRSPPWSSADLIAGRTHGDPFRRRRQRGGRGWPQHRRRGHLPGRGPGRWHRQLPRGRDQRHRHSADPHSSIVSSRTTGPTAGPRASAAVLAWAWAAACISRRADSRPPTGRSSSPTRLRERRRRVRDFGLNVRDRTERPVEPAPRTMSRRHNVLPVCSAVGRSGSAQLVHRNPCGATALHLLD
jgi:hypothetical protein